MWSIIFVSLSFALYIYIAYRSKAQSTNDFYIANHNVHPIVNGMATAADWMSAASFLSMAGLIAFQGYGGSVYLLGWTGGYVLLAILIAPYLREYGKFTVPEFIGDRFNSNLVRVVAVICSIFISFTYIAGQMKGVGVAFAGFLGIPYVWGIGIGMLTVFFYAVWGGMRGVTYTQVAQYCILIFAYTVPAIFISLIVTGTPIPQLGFIQNVVGTAEPLLGKLDRTLTELGFIEYTQSSRSMIDMFAITAALMFGTAGLPHVIIRFFTVPNIKDARTSAGWALVFIALLYLTAPTIAAFARLNFIDSINEVSYVTDIHAREIAISAGGDEIVPQWFLDWEETGLVSFEDTNQDGKMQIRGPNSPDGAVNEVIANRDIIVLANPQIAGLPEWVIGLVVAGGLAAALSTAAGLLIVISSAISHDICRTTLMPNMSNEKELFIARASAGVAVFLSGLLGVFASQLGFVAQVVAFAFGLASASLFPAILLGIFWKRFNWQGALTSMLVGLLSTFSYIYYFKFGGGTPAQYWLGISPEGIGFLFMILAFVTGICVCLMTPAPDEETQQAVIDARIPKL